MKENRLSKNFYHLKIKTMIVNVGCQANSGANLLRAKTWMVMKLTIAFLLFSTFRVSANDHAQQITIVKKNASLTDVFKAIEQQTGYLFYYDKPIIQKTAPIDLAIRNATLEQTLSVCVKDRGLTYSVVKNTVVIRPDRKTTYFNTHSALIAMEIPELPPVEIHGKVRDENGNPLANASVRLKGTNQGVTTNNDGDFTISVPSPQAVLVISFTGYTSQEIPVGNRTNITIGLSMSNNPLNEVVVTALGIKRQAKSLGYSTTTVDTKEITTARTTNVGNSLVGKVAGLNVSIPNSGPGGASKIRIRGQSSFGGNNSPLIIVNGVPINNDIDGGANANSEGFSGEAKSDEGDGLQSINPDDIESMTVLKGAAAAALYGFRAKDNAIIITTKSGQGHVGIGVELNSNFQADKAIDFTDFQYEYGQGE
ncbi:MAG: TonB-dependent receptor plug domain-containing protein, partial [Ginsengibacter sp.]